jgi:hypothetical protein
MLADVGDSSPEETAVFVIRIWRELRAAGGGPRRGYVEHLASGQRWYFGDPAGALEFVAALSRWDCDEKA